MSDRPAVLVLTLYSGEAEYGRCRESLNNQTYSAWEHRTFENLPNAEAHTRLYETVMAEHDAYDLFLKLDADMVLADDGVLARIDSLFRRITELDHLVLGAADWFTDSDIIGVHTFSRRVRWLPNPSGLFTDPDPVFPGRKLMITHPRPVAVYHGSDPSSLQAFYFGVHRAMKACQRDLGRAEKQPFGARVEWGALRRLWRHYQMDGDPRLGLALHGADLVFRGSVPATAVDRQSLELHQAFRQSEALGAAELRERLETHWSASWMRQLLWIRAMGPRMSLLVAGRAIRDGLTAPVRFIRRRRQNRLAKRWAGPTGSLAGDR